MCTCNPHDITNAAGCGSRVCGVIGPDTHAIHAFYNCPCQVATAEAFEASVRDRLLSASDVADCLLPIVLATIKKDKPEEVCRTDHSVQFVCMC